MRKKIVISYLLNTLLVFSLFNFPFSLSTSPIPSASLSHSLSLLFSLSFSFSFFLNLFPARQHTHAHTNTKTNTNTHSVSILLRQDKTSTSFFEEVLATPEISEMELQSEAEAFLHSVCVDKLDCYLVPVFVQASPVFPLLPTGNFLFISGLNSIASYICWQL